MLVGLVGLITLLGGFGTWAGMTQISGAVIASGRIEVDQNRQVVQHPDGGVVEKIEVAEGETVEAGEVLVRLDPTELRSELSIIENQLSELMARRARLEAERDGRDTLKFAPLLLEMARTNPDARDLMEGQQTLMTARAESMTARIDQLSKRRDQIIDQIKGIEAQQVALTRQLELIAKELADQQSLLDRGLAQATRVLGLQREEARLTGTMGELASQKAQSEGRITEIDLEILTMRTEQREEAVTTLRDLQFRELELGEQRRALLERLNRLDITAPATGIVYDLRVFALRSVIRPADPLMYVIPQDRPLVINAEIDSIHVDKLHIGQEVTLRFSADAFEDEQTRANYYRAEVVLNDGEQERLPEGVTLVPGMPVETFIRTEDRTPIAYLVKPFTDYLAKAFRE
jgi:HlyD family secretion protein